MSIFRAYDIRGIWGEELTEEVAENVGKAYGGTLPVGSTISVGRDVRLSGPDLMPALIKGLVSTGLNVIDVGVVPTPLLYFSIHNWDLDGGIMITGSHNPPKYNGFKMCRQGGTLYGPHIKELEGIIEKGDFRQEEGSSEKRDIIEDYVAYVSERVSFPNKLKVVVDSANGTGGAISKRLFTELGCEVIPLFEEPDGNFPNHPADPTVDSNLTDLINTVKETGADLGVGYDGDSDRCGVVTDKGEIVRGDQILVWLSKEVLEDKPGSPIIYEVKCSQALTEEIKKAGGEPIMYRTGHSFIKKKMKETGAPIAGEMSGHFFFAHNYPGFDDGIYASLKVAEYVSCSGKKASELYSELPHYVSTPEIRVRAEEDVKFKIVEEVTNSFKERYGDKVIDVDGMRLQLPEGWGLIRASNTGPKLILRFEAKTQEDLDMIKKLVLDELWKFDALADELCKLDDRK